ncbi:MAG: GNAT family N-acetyltransferase [Oscillospiraceae bacterium]|nr:GNAT family N-acetyltransferase [Oscillospiraceae bacterium]
MELRRVETSEQIAAAAALAGEIWTGHYTPLIGAAQVAYMLERFQSEEAIGAAIREEGYRYYLAGDAGYCAVKPEKDGVLFLSKLYVRKESRGQGLARRMLDCALAEHPGTKRVRLTVNRGNADSIEAYKKMGFRVKKEIVADIGGGFVMDDYLMERAVFLDGDGKDMINLRVDVLGVPFDAVTPGEAVQRALRLMETGGGYVVTPNPEIVFMCRNNPEVMDAVAGADMILADGIGVVKAAKRLKTPLPCRVTGVDWFLDMLKACEENGKSVFLLGGKPGAAEAAARKYPAIRWTLDGYFSDDAPVIDAIQKAGPDFLAVCLSAPRQELWMRHNRAVLGGILMAGLGGSVDVLAGTKRRGPAIFRKLGLEWLFTAIVKPSRIPRLFVIPKFMLSVRREAKKRAKER